MEVYYLIPIMSIILVNSWLAIGWAGDLLAATTVLKKLCRQFGTKRATRAQIFRCLNEIENLSPFSCIIVGWLSDKEGVLSFRWESSTQNLDTGNSPYAIGTGTSDFLRDIMTSSIYSHGEFPEKTSTDAAVRAGITFLGNILGREIFTGTTIEAAYGGGVELIYFSEGRFHQVNGITFLFFRAIIQERTISSIALAPIIISTRYIQDHLVIKTTRLDSPDRNTNILPIKKTQIFFIQPIVNKQKQQTFEPVTYFRAIADTSSEANYYCNVITAPRKDSGLLINCLAITKEGAHDLLRFQVNIEEEIFTEQIGINSKLFEILTNHILLMIDTYG